MTCEVESLNKRYKGYRIYFAGYTNGICVDNPQGIRVASQLTAREAKHIIRELNKTK